MLKDLFKLLHTTAIKFELVLSTYYSMAVMTY